MLGVLGGELTLDLSLGFHSCCLSDLRLHRGLGAPWSGPWLVSPYGCLNLEPFLHSFLTAQFRGFPVARPGGRIQARAVRNL